MLIEQLLRLNLQHFAEGEETPVVNDPEPPADNEPPEPAKTFTQEELDKIVKERLQRDRNKYADYNDIKGKLAEFEAAEQARKEGEMTELDKLKSQLETKDATASELTSQLTALQESIKKDRIKNAFNRVASSKNIEYLEDAFVMANLDSIEVADDGTVTGLEDAVEELVKNKPYLVTQKVQKPVGEPTNGSQKKADKTSEQMLHEAAEKARKSGRLEDRVAYANLKRELGQ